MCSGHKEELDLGQEGGSLSLKIDTAFARSYEKRKRGEELSRLRDKYGDDTETESSCSELEDEFGKGLSAENDKSFLRVLSLIRQNNSALYDPSAKFYATESDTSLSEEEPSLLLRDYEREQLLREGPQLVESGSECEAEGLAYNPEQREIKRDLLEAARGSSAANEELNGSDFLQPRVKSRAELTREDTDYAEWLKTNPNLEMDRPESISVGQADDLSHLRGFWSRTDISEEDRFLRDYLLERRHMGEQGEEGESSFDDQDLDQLDEADEFERKYNFRFEEDDSSIVARYPRIVFSSVRREDTRRRDQRKTRTERKEKEKLLEREEIKRLKNLKKMEIQDKIELIKKITGNQSLGVTNLDLSADFDSELHDREMSSVFNQEYLNEKEFTKPDLSSLLPEDLQDSESDSELEQKLHCEDEGFIMDADYIADNKQKKYTNNNNTPNSLPPNSHIERSLEDYYNIEYQDKIGDLACRMKYRQVVPNSFGLSIEEILSAKDRELNQWSSLKKTVQFRSEGEERRDVKKYSKKAKNLAKKNRVFLSLYEEELSQNATSNSNKIQQNNVKSKSNEISIPNKLQRRIINNNKLSDKQKKVISQMSTTRLKAYNINPKKGIKKRKDFSKNKSFV